MKSTLITFIAAFILGLVAYHMFLAPEVTETVRIETRTETDTVYQVIKDTVEVTKDRIVTEYLRDTVIREKTINLSRFRGFEPLTYGRNINYSGIVAGELIKIGFTTDFEMPKVTNTIYRDRTVTKTIEQSGNLYVGGFVSSGFTVAPAISYQAKGWQVWYSYEIGTEVHRVGVMKGLF